MIKQSTEPDTQLSACCDTVETNPLYESQLIFALLLIQNGGET